MKKKGNRKEKRSLHVHFDLHICITFGKVHTTLQIFSTIGLREMIEEQIEATK